VETGASGRGATFISPCPPTVAAHGITPDTVLNGKIERRCWADHVETLRCEKRREYSPLSTRHSCIDSSRKATPTHSMGRTMNDEDFQAGGDRFPLTRRSVSEPCARIDPGNGAPPGNAVRGVLKPVSKYVR